MVATLSTPGFALFRGRVACSCLRAWIPVYEQELIRLGVIKKNVDIAQLTGSYSKSGGTHDQGGTADLWQWERTAIQIAREMGAAAFARTPEQGFDHHDHLVLKGCPHNGPARYQIVALERSPHYNGLGYAGLGGLDDGPGPKKLRTYTAGIRWARARQKAAQKKEDEEMKMIRKEYRRYRNVNLRRGTQVVPIDDKTKGTRYSAITPGKADLEFDVQFQVGLLGLPAGQVVQARVVQVEKNGKVYHRWAPDEIIGTAGAAMQTIRIMGSCKKGKRIRLELETFRDDVVLDYVRTTIVYPGR